MQVWYTKLLEVLIHYIYFSMNCEYIYGLRIHFSNILRIKGKSIFIYDEIYLNIWETLYLFFS